MNLMFKFKSVFTLSPHEKAWKATFLINVVHVTFKHGTGVELNV